MTEDIGSVAKDLSEYDEGALIELLGLRAKALQTKPEIAGHFMPDISYDAKYLGPLDDLKALGLRILKKWKRELFNISCGSEKGNSEDRNKILNALSLGEGAAIAALIPVLTGLGLAPALAAALAAIVVKRFLGTAFDTICEAWKEQLGSA